MVINVLPLDEITRQATQKVPSLDDGTGNSAIIRTLQDWGIHIYAGVNGGGIIHFAKYLRPIEELRQVREAVPQLLTVNEDVASFIPDGYNWATGKIAGAIFTTGGAAFLGQTGLLAAKMHNIPMVAVAALSGSKSHGKSPLQYTGKDGSNTIGVYRSLLGKGAIVLDTFDGLEGKLQQGQEILKESKPVAFLIVPDKMSEKVGRDIDVPWKEVPRGYDEPDVRKFLSKFPKETQGKRVVIYVGEEAARYKNIQDAITEFSAKLKAPVVYAMNGVNAVSPDNKQAAGFIGLGFNDYSWRLWKSLGKDDTVVCIGYDPGEYEMNSANIPGNVWHLTNETRPYGSRRNSFAHRVDGKYTKVKGDLELTLEALNTGLRDKKLENIQTVVPESLNDGDDYGPIKEDTIDLVDFYRALQKTVKPGSIFVHDVCQAYKDEQRVLMRPIPGVKRWDAHRDSFMSGGLGVAIGIKMGAPDAEVEYFVGDGCFAYNEGALAFARNLGLGIWVMDNGNHHIVDKGLDVIYGAELDRARHHSVVPRSDYAAIARAKFMEGYTLEDPGQLSIIFDKKYANSEANLSTVISIPVDGMRVIGQNPRLHTLGSQGKPTL